MTKRRKTHEEQRRSHQQDDDYIPVPIQTFLWRQTSPFVRPFLGKARDLAQIEQRDACKLFERVIITNNIWGQSPSLTDAIASIDRWRLIKVSFPFVLQCTAALLNNKLIKDHNFNRLGGNEAKMMYTLQWILMNASEECADSENEAKANANNVAIAAATAASLLKPSAAATTTLATASQQQQQQQPMQGSTSSAASTGIIEQQASAFVYPPVPSAGSSAQQASNQQQQSSTTIIPAAANAAASSVVAVAAPSAGMSTLQMQTTLPSSSSVSPIGSSTPTKPLTPTNQPAGATTAAAAAAVTCPSNYLLPIYSIHMFVYHFAPIMESLKHSDFLTSNQRLEMGAALWEPLFNHQLPNIQCLIAQVKPQKNRDAALYPRTSSLAKAASQQHETSAVFPAPPPPAADCRRRSSSIMTQDQSQFGDVFLGGPSSAAASTSGKLADARSKRELVDGQQHGRKTATTTTTSGTNYSISSQTQQFEQQAAYCATDATCYATHLDIAVLRCLFIADWQESGVYWAITFLANRMAELRYTDECEIRAENRKSRARSKSFSDLDQSDLRAISLHTAGDKCTNKRKSECVILRPRDDEDDEDDDSAPQRRVKQNKEEQSASNLLRVDDADDSGDGSRAPRSPVRRLSFSSGMQTLANQIRKTSKRVRKKEDANESPPSSPSMLRRSSSADELNSSAISALSAAHAAESHPVITVTTNSSSQQQQQQQAKSSQKCKTTDSKKQTSSAKSERQYLMQRLYARSLKRLDRITRSQTIPKNLHFSAFETKKDQADQGESLGAVHYVDDYGRIDPIVVLKVLHSISQRETACSQRVCDKLLSLAVKLINLGILKENFNFSRRTSHQHKDLTNLLSTQRQKQQHVFTLLDNKPHVLTNLDSAEHLSRQQYQAEVAARTALVHKILIDITFRLFHHLGCPNHCGMESTIDHYNQSTQTKLLSVHGKKEHGNDAVAGRNLRIRLRETLDYLSGFDRQNFIKYVQCLVSDRALQQVVDILHSILGFCRSDYLKNLDKTCVQFKSSASGSSIVHDQAAPTRPSHIGEHRSSIGGQKSSISPSSQAGQETQAQGSASGGKKSSVESVENIIVLNSFKQLITRMASLNKELKLQENTSLYCDIRRMISFIRENYNSVFRGIVLSALIDCAKIINQQQRPATTASSDIANNPRKAGDLTRPPSDDESAGENGGSSLRRGGGKTTMTSEGLDINAMDHDFNKVTDATGHGALTSASQLVLMNHRTSFQQHSQSTGILSLSSKAKKKFEQVFGSKPLNRSKMNSAHLGEDLAGQSGSAPAIDGDQTAMDDASRRASIVGHQSMGSFQESNYRQGPPDGNSPQQHPQPALQPPGTQLSHIQLMKQNQQIYEVVRVGMTNFSFLMESCSPGDFLDPAMLAALLDLKSPIAVRAAIYLECANFVHRCNRGQWPSWMRMNVSTHRNSQTGILQSSSSSSKFRKSSSIQRTARNNTLMYRAAGRAFYSWAEAIGARLEELVADEQGAAKDESTIVEDAAAESDVLSEQGTVTNSQANDNLFGSDIDFYQPTLSGNSSPFALKMAACQLLFEVTTFLRETYRYLPPTIVHHLAAGSKGGDKMSSIYDVSRAVTANRRWSMALSSLGFGQLPATLNAISASAANAQPASSGSSQHLRNPTTSSISEHPERRISFILHETNDENEQQDSQQHEAAHPADSAAAVTSPLAPSVNTAEQQQDAMKKMTAGRHLSQSSASSAVVVAAATCLLRSSGVIDSQSHRRKSIKLKKTAQDKEKGDKKTKFAQDLDEENENSSISDVGIRRTDSLRSRRRVSGISERSDTSERVNNPPHIVGGQDATAGGGGGATAGGELSGDESAGNGSCEDAYANEAAEKFEADESRIMSNMPWFKAITLVNSSIDCKCIHYPSCKQYCYKLHQNMCKRLISCVQSIYQDSDNEQNYAASIFENRLANFINLGNQQRVSSSQDFKANAGMTRAGSECSGHLQAAGNSDGETKRKEKKSKKQQHQLDSPLDDLAHVSPKIRKQQQDNKGGVISMKSFHLDSIASGGGNGANAVVMNDALKALTAAKAKKRATAQRTQEEPPIVKYMKSNVKSLLHCPMSSFLKGAVILSRDIFVEMTRFSWCLLLEDDQQLSRTAAVGFIIASIKCPAEASKLLLDELECDDASRKIAAINKFYVVWDARYQCWPRLEDGAFVHFKMAPPSIEFTLPSPKIAQESKPVVDPPWMPRKTSNVEEVTIGQDQTVQKSFVTATKTRRKQQIEIVTKALREKHDKLREDRENYHITSAPITLYAAYEPTLGNQPGGGGDEMDGGGGGGTNTDEDTQQENRALLQMKTAQALFPTCLCQAAIVMINLLDDSRVTYEGSAVYEIANKVIWSCLVEDPALFLRHFFERLTRQNQNTIFQVLRRLIRFMPRLPPQAAYTLYNYLIGFIIYYIRCPVESSQKLIADTLSVLCLVVPSVYGLFLKDLKQILRKEQCDHNLLITANVPSAKKIIVHGSDSSGIPSQFPIDESTQFYHILVDSLEFFGIEKPKQNEYFLIDVRTNHMHNLHSYVRDYYSFKRSQHPQLQLINMDPDKAFDILQKQELINQFLEFGKVSMSLSIVKSSYMAVQRVLFLHEELMKLPTFPRTALMTNFSLFRGPLGHQVFSMDRIHKICWVRVIARMFELTSGFFLQLGDIHLFLNAISGIFVLHCEEASVSRLCLATFINATHQFKNIFATEGFMPMMATIVQVYSNHQNNQLLCRSIEFVCKQFYIMHRKPFLLQLFGSVASKLNTAEVMQQNQANYPLATNQPSNSGTYPANNFVVSDPNRISPAAFFRLLQSLEKAFKDPLDILELVDAEKPLRAIDFCYQQDKEAIEILDIISLCVTVTAYASESPRSTQMLIILETVVPLYMKHLQASTSKKACQSGGSGKQAHKDELQKIQSISICIRTLIVNCEGLTRNFNGPLPSIDFRNSSIRRTGNKSSMGQQKSQGNSAGAQHDLYTDEPSYSGPERGGKRETNSSSAKTAAGGGGGAYKSTKRFSNEEGEITRGEFIVPRDTLLNLVAEFLSLSTGRLVESAKKYVELHQKHSSYELLDIKSHLRLAEVANSLLKFASTDPSVMACRGLTRYMNEILPNTEWRQEAIRPALIMILKRLDKTFNRIAKKTWVKRTTDWEGAKQLLKGAYLTFIKHPYIVHLPHLKSLINCCQNIILSDGLHSATQASSTNLFHGFSANQPGVLVSQSASAIPQQLQSAAATGAGDVNKQGGNLLNVGGSSHYAPGASLSPSGSGVYTSSAPSTAYATSHNQQVPSFAAVTAAATLAERLAGNNNSSAFNPITSQGFNSVTIRLIAMQLLQTGDSQTLESFIGNSMNAPEKLESLMLNLIYPMCIRVCSGAREAPKLRICDIMFTLNIVLSMLAPQSASSKNCSAANSSPKAATDTSQFILSKITTTIGSTQTGATALGIVGGSSSHSTTNAHQLAQHQDGLKIGFLGLKILCVCFESQLASEWIRISRVIRDLAMQSGQPSAPLWDFLDFVATYRFPLYILLLPVIKCHLAKKVKSDKFRTDNIQCQRMIESKLHGVAPTVCRSKSFLFVSLTAELRMLKEQLITKRRLLLEGERQTSTSHLGPHSLGTAGGAGSLSPNQGGQFGDSSQQGDHFTAYHRLSAAIASFANQSAQGRMMPNTASGSGNQQTGTSAALKGTCFAAQLATSAPIGPQIAESSATGGAKKSMEARYEPSQSSIRLSTAKSREEARKVMNTILRRTSYPHNQILLQPDQGSASGERKNSQPPSPSTSANRQPTDLESRRSNQIIMDPAMLMAAFPAPRKSTVEGSGILKQLIQSIDRQNQSQKQQQQQQKQQQTSSGHIHE